MGCAKKALEDAKNELKTVKSKIAQIRENSK